MTSRFHSAILPLVSAALVHGCAVKDAPASGQNQSPAPVSVADSMESVVATLSDSAASARVDSAGARREPTRTTRRKLSPLADSIAQDLVFAARGENWFTASARGKRMLMDIGRIDVKIASPEELAAFQEAAESRSPVRIGDRFLLRGSWGVDSAIVSGYGVWNGRIVTTLAVPSAVDSLARTIEPLIASAVRAQNFVPTAVDTCPRDTISEELFDRAGLARDSIEQALRDASTRLPERLQNALRVESSQVIGCFAESRVFVVVTVVAGNYEYVRQSVVFISDSGHVAPFSVTDARFRAHQALHAFDADGDGIDDVAVRGRAERMGATVVLRYNKDMRRLERVTGGFAWETF